jgi:uncharacterized phage protein (TIGR02220 family)
VKQLKIPIEFFKAIGEKPHPIRLYWIKWLADYTEHLFRPDFVEFFHNDMEGKNLNLETIKEAYEFGIKFLEDGFTLNGKKVAKKPSEEEMVTIQKVILYLNERSNSTYTTSKSNVECLSARIKEGYTIADFRKVIDKKVEQWLGTEQEKYLRPITLFQAKKFENYLNEPENNPKKDERTKRQQGVIQKLSIATQKAKEFFK